MKKSSPKHLDIYGTPGDDYLVGTADIDHIEGFGGNDTLIGEGGQDFLTGGPGNDTYRVDGQDVVVEFRGGGYDALYSTDGYSISAGVEIELLAYINPASTIGYVLVGNEFTQTIIGSAGNDELYAGFGENDVLAGLGGNDQYHVWETSDVVFDDVGGGLDTIFVHNTGSYTLLPGQEIETLSVYSDPTFPVNLTGNEFANRLTGSTSPNILIGGGGNDILEGRQGSDVYRVEDFGDIVVESGGASPADIDAVYVAMHLSGYTLNNEAAVEVLSAIDPASAIAFNLTGNGFANTIFGTAGVNVLIGGGGADTLVGGAGNDVYLVEEAGDRVLENAGGGYDSVYATASYALTAGAQIEVLSAIDPASAAAMDLTGNGAANEIYGNAGANILDGRSGTDLLFGRGGADIFAFTVSADQGDIDMVADFLAGADRIGLDDSVFAGIGAPGAFNASAFVVGGAAADADDRIVYNQATGQLFYDFDGSGAGAAYQFATLAGAPILTAGDFTLI
jgi:Ca2+-binding RTX toxin-like protein